MTREEARKLLSGYATGSLTELERQLLFDAALDDQELFDELAEEQVMKEIIDLPGAKDRLIAALTPEVKPQRTFVWWPWATGVAAFATIAIAVWITQRPTEETTQLAVNAIGTQQSPAEPAPEPKVQPRAIAPAPVTRDLEAQEFNKDVAPAAPPAPAAQPVAPPEAEKANTLADRLTPTENAPVPAQLEARARQSLPILAIGAAKGKAAPTAQAFLASGPAATSIPSGEGLTYDVRPTGILRITPSRPGVLEVTFDGRSLFPSNPVIPGAPIDVSIPLEAKQLRIDFATATNAPAPAAVQSQESTGTLTLPTGPNPRAIILIPAQR